MVVREPKKGTSYDHNLAAFEKFDAENPHIFKLYVRFSREAKNAGYTKFSISSITERIRWETMITTRSEDGFKLTNNHKPFYARKLSAMEEFKDFFILHEQTSRRPKKEQPKS